MDDTANVNFRAEGDRVPTRERGYRSANQNFRRRGDMIKQNQQMGGLEGLTGVIPMNNNSMAANINGEEENSERYSPN